MLGKSRGIIKKELEATKKGIDKEIEEMKKIVRKEKNELFNGVSYVITSRHKTWKVIRKLQESGKLPKSLHQVFVYTIPRQYERNVNEMEHYDKILEVREWRIPFLFVAYDERVFHYTCLNPRAGRLHILLKKGYSVEDLYGLLHSYGKDGLFIPPKYL